MGASHLSLRVTMGDADASRLPRLWVGITDPFMPLLFRTALF
jgi:hypothetical protein